MKIYMLKTAQGLKPAYETDYSKYQKLKIGEIYKCEIKQERNYEFLKKFMALINLAFHNQEKIAGFDQYRYYLTMKAGFYHAITTDKGVFYLPQSISFSSMSKETFEELYSKMIDIVIEEIGITSEEIQENIINFL